LWAPLLPGRNIKPWAVRKVRQAMLDARILCLDRHESDTVFARSDPEVEGKRRGPIRGIALNDEPLVANLIRPSDLRIFRVTHGLAVQPRDDWASLSEPERSGVPRPPVQGGFTWMAFEAGGFAEVIRDPLPSAFR
jgi:hypothetical protein